MGSRCTFLAEPLSNYGVGCDLFHGLRIVTPIGQVKLSSFEAIIHSLNDAKVRFIVVGGLAVNAHGYLRFTNNVDLVIQLSKRDIVSAFHALEEIGYRPSNPVTAEDFADANQREIWRREKGMRVLKMWSDTHRETPLDIFTYEPFDLTRNTTSLSYAR